jgi:hypothetical protein
MKQQSAGRHVAPLGHIILILNINIMKKDLMPKIGFGLQLNSIIFNGF